MSKHLRKVIYVGLATLMVAGLGASISSNANASITPDSYGVDVFPSKRTHNRFAYQLRNRGHNSRIYYANRNSNLGKAIFSNGVPNNDYANYMARHHHKLFRSVTKKLERRVKGQKRIHKISNRNRRVAKRNKHVRRYNRKIRKHVKRSRKQNVLKARFKRSNNKRALKRSGFYDAHAVGGNFIFNKYAPNDKRAVVSKRAKVDHWYKGRFGQAHPVGYVYVPQLRGWIQFK